MHGNDPWGALTEATASMGLMQSCWRCVIKGCCGTWHRAFMLMLGTEMKLQAILAGIDA